MPKKKGRSGPQTSALVPGPVKPFVRFVWAGLRRLCTFKSMHSRQHPAVCVVCGRTIDEHEAFCCMGPKGRIAHVSCWSRRLLETQARIQIKAGDLVRTERGIGRVKSVTMCYSPVLVDIFYGDGKTGYCYLTDRLWPGWGRSVAEGCEIIGGGPLGTSGGES